MTEAFAPYRVSLFGGGTDYPEWYFRKGGIAVNFTIRGGIRVAAKVEEDTLTRVAIENSGRSACYVTAVADYPKESGLGGSAAYAVALLASLNGEKVLKERMLLADAAYGLEREVGRMVGVQDHLAAAIGGANIFWFRPGGKIEREEWRLGNDAVEDLCKHMMLLPVQRKEKGSEVAKRYVDANMEKTYQRALQGLAALEGKDWQKVGYELHRSWQEKRVWSEGVTTEAVDRLIDNACRMGAWGAKLLGAGSGGYVLVMAEDVQDMYRRILRSGYDGGMMGVYPWWRGVELVAEGDVMSL